MSLFSLAIPLFLASTVFGHGYVTGVTIDGQYYGGNLPGGNESPSIIRGIGDQYPITNAYDGGVNCGTASHAAALVANVNPGSTFQPIIGTNGGKWPHNAGPILTYLGDCGETPANECDSYSVKWFKIAAATRKPDSMDWYQQDIMNGQPAYFTLPTNLAPGNYLVRHEIIALHLVPAGGSPEFYPRCIQIKVGGNENGRPNANELVSFPGGYYGGEPGLANPDIYTYRDYTAPGPAIANLVASAAPPPPPPPPSPQTTQAAQPEKTPAPTTPNPDTLAPANPSGSCRKQFSRAKKSRALLKRNISSHIARHHHNIRARSP